VPATRTRTVAVHGGAPATAAAVAAAHAMEAAHAHKQNHAPAAPPRTGPVAVPPSSLRLLFETRMDDGGGGGTLSWMMTAADLRSRSYDEAVMVWTPDAAAGALAEEEGRRSASY
jgi:hypothetical protein